MSYAASTYGAPEYAGMLGGSAPVPVAELEVSVFLVTSDSRSVTLRRQDDPVVPYENREVVAMPSATVDPQVFVKDPAAVKDYSFDWSEILDTGETIVSALWDGGGLTVSGQQITGESAYAFLSGGTPGTVYIVSCTITSSAGRTYCRELLISIEST